MKYVFLFVISTLSLLSCSNKTNVELIADKLNEITGNPDFSKNEMIKTSKGYYVIHITDNDDIKSGKDCFSVLIELQDYIYNELNVTCDEKSLISDNIEIIYESNEAIITTTYQYRNIGPSYHPIWHGESTIIIDCK